MEKSKSQEDWVVLTDVIDTEDAFTVELKEELEEANIPFTIQKTDDSESASYWFLVEQDNFDDAYNIMRELETMYKTAADDAKWVKLTSYTYEIDPELAFLQNELRNNDIRFTVWNANLSTINPLMGGATGGVQVMITEPDTEKALEILRGVRSQMDEVRKDMKPKNMGCLSVFLIILGTLTYYLSS